MKRKQLEAIPWNTLSKLYKKVYGDRNTCLTENKRKGLYKDFIFLGDGQWAEVYRETIKDEGNVYEFVIKFRYNL